MQTPFMTEQRHGPSTGKSAIRDVLVAATLVTGALLAAPASAAVFPQCHDVSVEMRIMRDFNWAEANTWNRGFELSGLERMHESRTVRRVNSHVTRRYCSARALLSNGERRTVWYMIEDIGGFVGKTWKVTHCVAGLDPWKNHDGLCRTLR